MTAKPEKRYQSSDLEALIAARYPTNEYATFFDVPNATGSNVERRADALTINLWPSRGLELEGFEIKVDRRDWLRELKAPEKADAICQFCHRWWIVAPEGVVADGELPRTWGLLVPKGNGLKAVVTAPRLEAIAPPLSFFAALCRSAQAQASDNGKIEAALVRGRREGFERGRTSGPIKVEGEQQLKIDRLTRERDELQKVIREVEEAAGVSLRRITAAEIGRAVKLVLDGKLPHYAAQLEQMGGTLRTALFYIDRQAVEAREVLAPKAEVQESACAMNSDVLAERRDPAESRE